MGFETTSYIFHKRETTLCESKENNAYFRNPYFKEITGTRQCGHLKIKNSRFIALIAILLKMLKKVYFWFRFKAVGFRK